MYWKQGLTWESLKIKYQITKGFKTVDVIWWHDSVCKVGDKSVAEWNDRLRTWTMLDCWNDGTTECKQVVPGSLEGLSFQKYKGQTYSQSTMHRGLSCAGTNFRPLKIQMIFTSSSWFWRLLHLGSNNSSHCPSWPSFLHPFLPTKHAELSMDPWTWGGEWENES